jgi:UDP-N-acetylmuramate: L-alanyl-gamma-D-glutamyl-meso-diaminopimelate ligase
MNALAAIAAARHAGVAPERAIEALADFRGVRRRLERRGEARGIVLYDDFAHHPTAIHATLEGLRSRVGAARILAVLEPRSNTMRLGVMKDRLAQSLQGADRTFLFAADLGWDPAAALRPLGARAQSFADLDALVAAVAAEARPGDHVLVMSNGGFGGVHGKLLRAIEGA